MLHDVVFKQSQRISCTWWFQKDFTCLSQNSCASYVSISIGSENKTTGDAFSSAA